jgi:two-component system, sensor histidine kinase RegB
VIPARSLEQLSFSWLLKLRWGAIAGQAVTIAAVDRLMHIRLPLAPLGAILAVELATNVFYHLRIGRGTREWERPALMALDVLLLTGLLYLTGGPFNPFSFFYLVEIALGAAVLRPRWIWTLVVLSLGCSGILFVWHRELPITHAEHMSIHLQGMWLAFGVAAAFIVYFLLRITRSLAEREAELESSRREAQRSERLASLATLAAGAAHELATPLGTIALVATELERALLVRPAGDAAADDVRLIREQVQRCRAILDQMAADAGQHAGESIVPCSLAELVGPPAANVRVELDPAALRERFLLPPRALAQAIRGIVKNALDAAGDASVRASCGSGHVRIEVRDRGPGMPAEVLAHAGEPFFTTKPPGQGMGLGIFLARALIERLGGTFRLESAVGRGTTAVLEVPAARQAPMQK